VVDKDDLVKILDRPQNVAILKFVVNKDWVTAEQISEALGINITLSMLYISDLEKAGLILRKLEEDKGEKYFMFKLADMKGKTLDEVLTQRETKISGEKVAEAIDLYIRMYALLIGKLNEVGGRSMVETIIETGRSDLAECTATEVVNFFEKSGKLDEALVTYSKKVLEEVKSRNFIDVKIDFIEVLKVLIEALERFMGRLYGQHVTKTSLKPVLIDKEELIHELDLLAGLPREYFPMGGA
jgi:predicted transcriptional regulator